ncbi:MAG TPA: hypothetical protein PLI70_01370 [Gemmatimonadales bacterium]|nr:hypothetical protein [Gemmatimonadales bacterium]HRZ09356.1 hypothetical protein [Gemmatimonadales bacterium]
MNRTMSMVAGIVLLGLGGFVLLRGANLTTRRDVLEVGDVKLTASESRSIPPWAGGVALVAGLALVAVGVQKRA